MNDKIQLDEQRELDEVQKDGLEKKGIDLNDPQKKDKEKKKEISKLHQAQPNNGQLLMEGSRIPDYKQTVEFAEEQLDERNAVVEAVYEASKLALSTKRKDAKVQTDQACMNNAQMYEYH